MVLVNVKKRAKEDDVVVPVLIRSYFVKNETLIVFYLNSLFSKLSLIFSSLSFISCNRDSNSI